MKLPNGDRAIVSYDKLEGYCLKADHKDGGHKAKVFRSALGITIAHADFLRAALLKAAATSEAAMRGHNGYGESYTIIFSIIGPNGYLDFIKSA